MAQRAAASRPADPVLARRLSLAAWRISRVSEAKGELLDSMSSPMSDSFADPYGTQGSLYALSPDGARLASYTPRGAGERGDLRIHDVAGKKLIAGVRWENQVTGLAFSPDSRTMAVADLSGVWLWPVHGEPRRGSPLIPWTEPQRPVTLTFSPGGRFITVVGEDVTETWDVERRVRVLSEEVVQVGPDDRLALVIPWQVRAVTAEMTSGSRKSGPRARRVELWDLVRGGRVDAPWLPARATTGAFSPDGRLLALATDEKGVVLFDLATGKAGGEPLDPSAEGLEFSADGRFLAAYSEGRVSLWSVRDGTRRVSVTLPPTGPDLLHRLSSGGRLLRVADSSGTVHTYDLSPHMGSGTLAPGTEARRFSPDGRLIAVATGKRDGWKVWIWDVATRKPLGAAEPDDPPENASPEGEGYEPVFSPDGRTLALTHPMSRVVTLWDVATNARIGAFELRWRGAGGVSRLVFSSDGRTVAVTPNSADDRDDVTELELWDLATRTWRRSFPMEAADLSFLPDGRLLALKRSTDPRRPLEGGAAVLDPATGKVSPYETDARVPGQVLFSGDTAVTGDVSGRVTFWNAGLRERLAPPRIAHASSVTALVPYPPGGMFASVSADEISLWEWHGYRRLGSDIELTSDLVPIVAFNRTSLLISYPDGRLVEITVDPDAAAGAICARNGALSPAQWRIHIPELPYMDTCAVRGG